MLLLILRAILSGLSSHHILVLENLALRHQLDVFVALSHDRRRVLHFNATDSPTAHSTAMQIVQAFPFDTAPWLLIRDRDKTYGEKVVDTLRAIGVEQVVTARKSPENRGWTVVGASTDSALDHLYLMRAMDCLVGTALIGLGNRCSGLVIVS